MSPTYEQNMSSNGGYQLGRLPRKCNNKEEKKLNKTECAFEKSCVCHEKQSINHQDPFRISTFY
jgi:hypothetical protein